MGGEVSDYWEHLNSLSELLQGLVDKSMAEDLGPADGKLYMNLCDFFTAHAELLESQTRESIDNRRSPPSEDEEKDAGSEGDRPDDSES